MCNPLLATRNSSNYIRAFLLLLFWILTTRWPNDKVTKIARPLVLLKGESKIIVFLRLARNAILTPEVAAPSLMLRRCAGETQPAVFPVGLFSQFRSSNALIYVQHAD